MAEVAAMLQIEPLLAQAGPVVGGQRQRVAMAGRWPINLALFLFDEPLSNLDAQRCARRCAPRSAAAPAHAHHLGVRHARPDRSHDAGDRIAVMKDGVIQQLGTPDTIYRQPANRFVAGFMAARR